VGQDMGTFSSSSSQALHLAMAGRFGSYFNHFDHTPRFARADPVAFSNEAMPPLFREKMGVARGLTNDPATDLPFDS
jgi:hypothetical protein